MIHALLAVAAALMPRQAAPALEGVLVTPELTFEDSSKFLNKSGYKVLIFYPHDFTFVCPTELLAFSDRIKEFNELGASILGVSVDSHFTHLAWMSTPKVKGGIQGLKFPLLADLNKGTAHKYGVLVPE
jgi:alkyl hydroperoxide reductase subunit AhpC